MLVLHRRQGLTSPAIRDLIDTLVDLATTLDHPRLAS
jgi:hypothetical protein